MGCKGFYCGWIFVIAVGCSLNIVLEEMVGHKNTYIVIMQWMAFAVAVIAFLFFVAFYLGMVHYDLKFVIPNLIAVYGVLIGVVGLLRGEKDRLSIFYIFMAICIFIIVNFVWFKF